MYLKLKDRIGEKYRNQRRFAVCCGKTDGWISRIVQGIRTPTPEEKEKIRIKLRISPEEIDSYFVHSTEFPAPIPDPEK